MLLVRSLLVQTPGAAGTERRFFSALAGAAAAITQRVQAAVDGDAVQPGAYRGPALEALQADRDPFDRPAGPNTGCQLRAARQLDKRCAH